MPEAQVMVFLRLDWVIISNEKTIDDNANTKNT